MEFVSLPVCMCLGCGGCSSFKHHKQLNNYCLPFCCCHVICNSTRWLTCLATPHIPRGLSAAMNLKQLKLCKTSTFTGLHRQGYHRVFICLWRWRTCLITDAGSFPDEVIGIFLWYNPSGRTMALGSSQPLTEISTRDIFGGIKAAGA